MLITVEVISAIWIFWCLVQLGFSIYFWRLMSLPDPTQAVPSGRVAVLMAVRGSDPSFARCIRSLLDQDHDDFEVHVVVDSSSDPAWEVIREVQSRSTLLFAHQLETPLETCGLKCSALIHGYESIRSEPDYLVLVDSDVVVHRTWLNELLRPLSNSSVGVVTGNQWFEPEQPASAATLVRSLWNAGAVVPTVMFSNPWAGSLAMRLGDVKRTGLIDIWRKSIVDDGPIRKAFEPLDLRVQFVPSLIMVNRESCNVQYVLTYVQRMLTWSRIYEPTFLNTVVHATITAFLLISLFALVIANLAIGAYLASAIAAGTIVGGALINLLGYIIVRQPVAKIHAERGVPFQRMTIWRLMRLTALSALTQLLYAKSVIGAMTARTIRWREATYQLEPRNKCRLMEYEPFVRPNTDSSII